MTSPPAALGRRAIRIRRSGLGPPWDQVSQAESGDQERPDTGPSSEAASSVTSPEETSTVSSRPSCAAAATVVPSGEAARSTTLPSRPSASSTSPAWPDPVAVSADPVLGWAESVLGSADPAAVPADPAPGSADPAPGSPDPVAVSTDRGLGSEDPSTLAIARASVPVASVTHTARPGPSTRGSLARAPGCTYRAGAGPSLCVSQCTVPRTSSTLACPV